MAVRCAPVPFVPLPKHSKAVFLRCCGLKNISTDKQIVGVFFSGQCMTVVVSSSHRHPYLKLFLSTVFFNPKQDWFGEVT